LTIIDSGRNDPPGGEIVERKLTAILCADVHGYSRLMGEDEEATHRTLTSYRKVIDSLIEQHRGRFVNEFASVVNAVEGNRRDSYANREGPSKIASLREKTAS
jgi:class 3 adenylate cyclase